MSETDAGLVRELRTVFHPNPTDEETQRGCEIIETLMRREKARLMEAEGKAEAEQEMLKRGKRRQSRVPENSLG